jgi:hypothetical protein
LPRPLALAFALAALAAAAPRARAADIVGPNKCTGCHDHDPQKDWWEKKEGPKGHLNSLSQLEDKKSAGYAKAIGLADPYDLKGSCVKCHATIFKGDANAGVSCETCHGAGSAYLEPHKEKGSYQKAVSLGMYDTRGNYGVWAKLCLDCHIMTDKKLIAAGHVSGADFEISVKSFGQVVHWKPAYDKAALAAAGKGYKPGGAAPAAVIARPPAPEWKEPVKPIAKPTEPKQEVAQQEPAKAEPKAAPAVPKPADRAASTGAPAAAPKVAQAPREPRAPRERPVPPPPAEPAGAPPQALVMPPPAPLPKFVEPPPAARGVVGDAAAARGKVLAALAALVEDGKLLPASAPKSFTPPPDYAGPDGELLRLQDQVLALELELLRAENKDTKDTKDTKEKK